MSIGKTEKISSNGSHGGGSELGAHSFSLFVFQRTIGAEVEVVGEVVVAVLIVVTVAIVVEAGATTVVTGAAVTVSAAVVVVVVEGGATTVVTGVTVTVGAAVVAAAIRCPEASNSEELDPPQPATSSIRINKAFLTDILKLFIPKVVDRCWRSSWRPRKSYCCVDRQT